MFAISCLIFFFSLKETLQEYNEVIRTEYDRVLAERLDPEEIEDRAARRKALRPEIMWYQDRVDKFIDHLGMQGKDRKIVKDMIRPVLKLVRFCSLYLIQYKY